MFIQQSIGIVGGGYVGAATRLLASRYTTVKIYDLDPVLCRPAGCALADLAGCDLIFVCVPTPSDETGACDTSIVESVIADLRAASTTRLDQIIVRSTVPPGTCARLGAHSMPEFLTERGWSTDCRNRKEWLVGLNPSHEPERTEEAVHALLRGAFEDNILAVRPELVVALPEEAETAKYLRNCFLAVKVAFANEASRYCEAASIDYARVRELFVLDQRIGDSHTAVPGPDGRCGFGGTCLPKDLDGMCAEFARIQVPAPVMQAAADRNRRLDRTIVPE